MKVSPLTLLLLVCIIASTEALKTTVSSGSKYYLELPQKLIQTLEKVSEEGANPFHPNLVLTKVQKTLQGGMANGAAFVQKSSSSNTELDLSAPPGTSAVGHTKMNCECRFVKNPNLFNALQENAEEIQALVQTKEKKRRSAVLVEDEETGARPKTLVQGARPKTLIAEDESGARPKTLIADEEYGARPKTLIADEEYRARPKTLIADEEYGARPKTLIADEEYGARPKTLIADEEYGARPKTLIADEEYGARPKTLIQNDEVNQLQQMQEQLAAMQEKIAEAENQLEVKAKQEVAFVEAEPDEAELLQQKLDKILLQKKIKSGSNQILLEDNQDEDFEDFLQLYNKYQQYQTLLSAQKKPSKKTLYAQLLEEDTPADDDEELIQAFMKLKAKKTQHDKTLLLEELLS